MCSRLHAPCLAAIGGGPPSPPALVPRPGIDPAGLVAFKLHSSAERRCVQRMAHEAARSVLVADDALAQMTLYLRHCSQLDVLTRSLIADHVRTAMVAHHAALLRVTEIERVYREMVGAR